MENLVQAGYKVFSVVDCPTWGEMQYTVKDLCGMHAHFWKSEALNEFPVCMAPKGCKGLTRAKYDNDGFRQFAGLQPATYPLFRDALLPLMAGCPDKAGTCKTNGTEWGPEWKRYHEVSESMSQNNRAQTLVGELIDFMDAARPMSFIHGDFNPGNLWKKADSTTDEGPYLYGDWQLGGMGPICFDFLCV